MPNAPFDARFFEHNVLFWPIARAASAFLTFNGWPPIDEYTRRAGPNAHVVFREQPKKKRRKRRGLFGPSDLYDGRIIEEGWVPTRPENWHDYLNMLVWASFPRAKKELHRRQHKAQAARIGERVSALPNARTREQDALALLDEGGVLIASTSGLIDSVHAALAQRRSADARAFFENRSAVALIFGHAVYEELVLGSGDVWCAGHFLPLQSEELQSVERLASAADKALANTLLEAGSFQSPAALTRVDIAVIRDIHP
ncbi:MAG: DUF3025 domain-containing protein [Polyangiaceae bacterium]|nr:DUF3025 domain-containing protein [Polyangiaceae bacterium]